MVDAANGVLANDESIWGPMTAEVLIQPASGALTLNADGSFIYEPFASPVASDTFTYWVRSAGMVYMPATVTIQFVNAAPTAVDDTFVGRHDRPTTGNVLANDADPDGDALTAALDSTAGNGTVLLSADGTFTYTPVAGFVGIDSFTYVVDDGRGGTALGTVTLDVREVVWVDSVQDALEGSSQGYVRLRRFDTSGPLTVNYTIDTSRSTATEGGRLRAP